MDTQYKFVDFAKYCKTCKNCKTLDTDEPCDTCLSTPARENSERPLNWEENK